MVGGERVRTEPGHGLGEAGREPGHRILPRSAPHVRPGAIEGHLPQRLGGQQAQALQPDELAVERKPGRLGRRVEPEQPAKSSPSSSK